MNRAERNRARGSTIATSLTVGEELPTELKPLTRLDYVRNLRTYESMQTVAELNTFSKAAKTAGMSEEDIGDLIDYLAANPDAGDEMEGTGGCRKLRWAIRGNNKGKSGGVRTITLFSGEDMPVFLITAFGKSQKVSLTQGERNSLKKLSDKIVQEYARRVLPLAVGE